MTDKYCASHPTVMGLRYLYIRRRQSLERLEVMKKNGKSSTDLAYYECGRVDAIHEAINFMFAHTHLGRRDFAKWIETDTDDYYLSEERS